MEKLLAFFEIPAADFGRAVKFYESVFQFKLAVSECEEEKMAFFPAGEEEVAGAISWAEGFEPSDKGVLIHFQVEDISDVLTRVEKQGGMMIRPKTKIECENRGYFAMFRDSEGNTVGLYSDK